MVYAAVYKRILHKKDSYNNRKLAKKLKRKLLPEEITYKDFEYFKYISILSFKTSNYNIRFGLCKDEAILYLEEDLEYIKEILKGEDYHIIDANTNPTPPSRRKAAAINIALQPETVGEMSLSSQ